MLRVLQVCNVGQIVGGTAACAWTITRSLPGCSHSVAFPGGVNATTREAFEGVEIFSWPKISYKDILKRSFDLVLFHNTTQKRLESDWELHFEDHHSNAKPLVVNYVHSKIKPARADLTWYCSKWLAERCGMKESDVLIQAVPKPKCSELFLNRSLRPEMVIGRICTPRKAKWPGELVTFYSKLSKRFEEIIWEFVGCPEELKFDLNFACEGRARFFPATWNARERYWNWDAMLYHNPHVSESFGRTCAEGMRAGCIPIVDSQGGFCEQIEEGTGFLCSSTDQFSDAIEQLQDAGIRRQRARSCERVGDERFSLERMRGEILRRVQLTMRD